MILKEASYAPRLHLFDKNAVKQVIFLHLKKLFSIVIYCKM